MSQKLKAKTETVKLPSDLQKESAKLRHKLAFEAYGVKVGIEANSGKLLDNIRVKLKDIFPEGWKESDFEKAVHKFSVNNTRNFEKNFAYKNDELLFSRTKITPETLEPQLRLTVAEFAENCIFLHAGAVSYNGTGIIIPGKSFAGKSTLVSELSKRGFLYFSDEYAVIDREGKLHPYAKKISMRGIVNDYTQVDVPVEEFGGKPGKEPVKIGMILVASYKKNAKFKPKTLSPGEGIIEAIANSVSIRRNPAEVLQTLHKVVADAKIIKTKRGEAKDFAKNFLDYLEENPG